MERRMKMNELEKAAREYSKTYSSTIHSDGKCTVIPSCTARNSFQAGAMWQAKQSSWISVEERLPEEYKEVLVRYKVCAETKYDVLFIYGSTSWCFADMEEYIDESMTVTHWMPIPELPKE